EPGIEIGPLISEEQLARVEQHVADAVQAGAKVVCGGRRWTGLPGAFYEPTLLTGVRPEMRVMREETFGPVLPVMEVDGEEQAIELANASCYGLGASVWTGDTRRGERIAAQVRA